MLSANEKRLIITVVILIVIGVFFNYLTMIDSTRETWTLASVDSNGNVHTENVFLVNESGYLKAYNTSTGQLVFNKKVNGS
jgi:hypothetical protein